MTPAHAGAALIGAERSRVFYLYEAAKWGTNEKRIPKTQTVQLMDLKLASELV